MYRWVSTLQGGSSGDPTTAPTHSLMVLIALPSVDSAQCLGNRTEVRPLRGLRNPIGSPPTNSKRPVDSINRCQRSTTDVVCRMETRYRWLTCLEKRMNDITLKNPMPTQIFRQQCRWGTTCQARMELVGMRSNIISRSSPPESGSPGINRPYIARSRLIA